MLDKIKALEPKVLALISMAPFVSGVVVGYVLRTPISWALDLVKLVLKV